VGRVGPGEKHRRPAAGDRFTYFEFMGEFVPANVIFGRDDAEPILGMIPLQSVGIEIDPGTGRLKRRHWVRLKMAR
jgi:hypothetical protein